jgi:CheY-like chemotaxis protein
LEHRGFEVVWIPIDSLPRALQSLRELRPDLIVARISPGGCALELVEVLRFHPDLREIPIVMLTSVTQPGAISAARQSGAVEVVVLPESLDRIEAVIRRYLPEAANPQEIS